MKKVKVVILILAIFLGINLGIFAYQNKIKKKEKEQSIYVAETLNKVAELFDKSNLNELGNFTNNANNKCYAYNKDDASEKIAFLKEVYVEPFISSNYFELVDLGNEKKLYICLPNNCTVDKLNENSLKITTTGDEKIVKIGEQEVLLQKIDDKWKFVDTFIYCQ